MSRDLRNLCPFLSMTLLLVCSFAPLDAADWQQWRGPHRTGIIEAAQTWPSTLEGESLQEVWSVDLAPSYSTPIVKGNRVFTTETRDKKEEVVRAYNRKTGEQLWEVSWAGSMKVPFFAAANGSWIRATPAADEQNIYVAGIRDVLVCIDQESGKVRWKVDFVSELGSSLPSFGFVSSPLIIDDAIYVQAGGGFVKLDKNTGKIIWRVLDDGGGMSGSAFSSPYLAELNGEKTLLVQTRTDLVSVEPADGKILWKQPIEAFRGMNIVTPVVFENKIFTSSYGGGSFLIQAANDGTSWSAKQEWRNKVQGYMSTPVRIGNHVYLHLRNQRFACVNLTTGKEEWITKPFGKYWSLVSDGNKILALDSGGELLLIEASPAEFKLLDRRKITDSSTWAHLVVAGDEIYIRALDKLHVFRWKSLKN